MAIIDVVKYNGTPDIFAWKYPSEDLATWTQLIVNESQEAVLFKGGKALDLFSSGRYTLETANIPILNNIINLPFGGRSPFAAEVWFINKVQSLDIKWGTPTPIQVEDPQYKVFIPIRSYGQFGIQISDSRKFLSKLVGTLPIFSKENVTNYFKGLYLLKVKDTISSYLTMKGISIIKINSYLEEISEYIKEKMVPILDEYGIGLVSFYVNDISVPEDNPAVKKITEALAKKAEMDIVGYTYTQERSFDVLQGAAQNPGSASAGIMGAGIGLGMGVGIGDNFGKQMGSIGQNINTQGMILCPNCNTHTKDDKLFCEACGYDLRSSSKKKSSILCSKCGNTYSNNVKYCPECGTQYNPCRFCGADLPKGATRCDICGKFNPKPCTKCGALIVNENMKFCPDCGEPLIMKCSICGYKLDRSYKFCPECGNKI